MNKHNHILIVEDDSVLSRMYEKVLRHKNFRVRQTDNIDEAIENLLTFDPDVISLDWNLNGETSLRFLEHISQLDPIHRPQILLVSGQLNRDDIAPISELVNAYQLKPTSLKDYVYWIEQLSERAAERVALYDIISEELKAGIYYHAWRGTITFEVIRQHIDQKLLNAQSLVVDLRHFNFVRFTMDNRDSHHPPLLHVRRILAVHDLEITNSVQVMLKSAAHRAEIQHFDNLDIAIATAQAGH